MLMVELQALHIILLRQIFNQNYIWGGHEIQCSITLPSTVTLALSLHDWAMCFAHPRTELTILSKCNNNPSRV